jgi:hypothetical protein
VKAGVDTHLHALRHFSVTQAIAVGFDAVKVGHSDPTITFRLYSYEVEQRDRELAASLRTLALPVLRELHVRLPIDTDGRGSTVSARTLSPGYAEQERCGAKG